MDLGMQEIAVILFIALLVYGGNLPAVALKVGGVVGQLKRALRETTDMMRIDVEAEARRTQRLKNRKPGDPPAEPEAELRPYRNPEDMPEDPDDGYADELPPPPIPPELATEDITLPESGNAGEEGERRE